MSPAIQAARRRRRLSAVALATFTFGSLGRLSAATSDVPRLGPIVVIVMENKSYDIVRVQPYTAGLIAGGTSFSSSYAVTHPSQPNYLALWAGSTLGVVNDVCPPPGSPYAVENLGHACEAAGRSWRAYSEDLPSVAYSGCTANGTLYTRKHDPWTDFSNLDHQRERPYADLAADIAAGTLPDLSFVIPNNCDNSHDFGCTAAVGDAWLASQVPAILGALGANGLLVLTWDEDDFTAGNHILTVFAGPRVLVNHVSSQQITHYTLLRTLCDALGLAPFGAAVSATPITDVWVPSVAVAPSRWGAVKSLFR